MKYICLHCGKLSLGNEDRRLKNVCENCDEAGCLESPADPSSRVFQ